ncbi:hypothetical protein [Mycolicibacterium phage Kashi_SSH1]|nr:hypothetical protein [Mycolicibacterium phage Kashi_SSH1]
MPESITVSTDTITLHQVSDDEVVRPATVNIRHIRTTRWNKQTKLTEVGLEAVLHSTARICVLEHPRRISLLIRRAHQAQVVKESLNRVARTQPQSGDTSLQRKLKEAVTQAQAPRDDADLASIEAYAQDMADQRAERSARKAAAEEQWKTDVSQQIRGVIERLETLQAARQVDASNNRVIMSTMSNLLAEVKQTNGALAEVVRHLTEQAVTEVVNHLANGLLAEIAKNLAKEA